MKTLEIIIYLLLLFFIFRSFCGISGTFKIFKFLGIEDIISNSYLWYVIEFIILIVIWWRIGVIILGD